MEVTKDNKSLWHIQNLNISSDGYPFDIFVWSDHEPTKEDLEFLAKEEFGECDDSDNMVEEITTSSEIYKVYATQLKGDK